MCTFKKFLEEHPEMQAAHEHTATVVPFVSELAKAFTLPAPMPYLQAPVFSVYSPAQQAKVRIDAFEKAHPDIVRLAELLNEYEHLKAEFAMTQLGQGRMMEEI